MEKEIRRITAEELKKDGYLLGFLKKSINPKGSGRIQRTLLESKVPLSLEEILEISANSDEGKALIKEASKKEKGRNPFDINNPTNRGRKVIDYFTNKKYFYKGFPAIGINAEGKYFLTKLSDFPELSENQSPNSSSKTRIKKSDNDYLPTMSDCERAYKKLTGLSPGKKVKISVLLVELEKDCRAKGKRLKSNWELITRENIKLWARRGFK